MPGSQTVGDIFGRGLSGFLDWMQREIAALNDDIVTRLRDG
jgi:hypothetical protein